MHVDLALFDGDALLERQEILVTSTPKVECFGLFRASYKLGPDAAEVVLDDFASRVPCRTEALYVDNSGTRIERLGINRAGQVHVGVLVPP